MDIEAETARFIARKVGVRALTEVPSQRPDEFVTVEVTGGESGRFPTRVSLAVQAWAQTRARALEIAIECERALWDLDELENVFNPSAEYPYRFPDPDSRTPRYQLGARLYICE